MTISALEKTTIKKEVTNHIVMIGTLKCFFKETTNYALIPIGGMQISGQAENITEFVNNSRLKDYFDFGYNLRYVLNIENSKNYTAFLYRQFS